MKKKWFFVLFVWHSFAAIAQEPRLIDSLEKVLKTKLPNKHRIQAYNLLSKHYISSPKKFRECRQKISTLLKITPSKLACIDTTIIEAYKKTKEKKYAEARSSLDNALKKASQLHYQKGVADAYYYYAKNHYYQSHYMQAVDFFHKALAIYESLDKPWSACIALNSIGLNYWYHGDLSKALDFYFKSLKKAEGNHYTYMAATSLNNIGLIYGEQGNYQQTLNYFTKALKIREATNDPHLPSSYQNMGELYDRMEEFDQSLKFYQKALDYTVQANDQEGVAYINNAIGGSYIRQKKFQKALKFLKMALKIRKKLKNRGTYAESLHALGQLYFRLKDYPKAIRYLEEAIGIGQDIRFKMLVRKAALILAKIYEATGNFKMAYQSHLLYDQMKDSLFNQKQTAKIARLQADYEFSKEKDSLKFAQAQERLLYQEESKRKATIQNTTYLGLAIALIFILVILVFLRDKQQNNQKLTLANNNLEESYEEIRIVNESLKKQKSELNATLVTVQNQQQSISDSIGYAQRIQEAILPTSERITQVFPNHFIFFKPLEKVSGDFYWMSDLPSNQQKTVLAAVDCTGHGVPGAFMSMIGNDLLNYIVNERHITTPHLVLEKLHQEVRQALQSEENDMQDGMDIALITYDRVSQQLQFSGAKNPILYFQNGQRHLIRGDRISIGGLQTSTSFTTHTIDLTASITFYLFSDGFQDQFGGPQFKKFMSAQLYNTLEQIHPLPFAEQKKQLNQVLESWMGDGFQIDDILVVGIRIDV